MTRAPAPLLARLLPLLPLLLPLQLACNASFSGSPDPSRDPDFVDAGQEQPNVDDISQSLESIRSGSNLPALTASVWRGRTLLAHGVAGVRKQGETTPATLNDRWHLGSDTKAMTATLVGIYVDRGRLHFEDTLADLLPGLTIAPGYRGVTIEELLQHRGGAPGEVPEDILNQMWNDGGDAGARERAIRALVARAPEQSVGSFVYSNAGYMIAGAALEHLTGASWEELMRQDLFEPLGMSSCAFGAPGSPSQVDQPWGHEVNGAGALVPMTPGLAADNPPSMGPAGTVHCSVDDWAKFFHVHLAGARHESNGLLSDATITRLQTPPAGGDYAAGWIVSERDWAGGLTLTHTGSNTLWMATVWLAPAKNLSLAAISNRGDDIAADAVDASFGPLIDSYGQ